MLTAISIDKKFIEARTFTTEDIDEIHPWLTLHKTKNLYYSVNEPVQPAYTSKHVKKSEVLRAHFIHVDVDPRTGEDVAKEQARILKQIQDYRIPPSFVVFSGGGYNVLWRLDHPVNLAHESTSDEETIRRAVEFERRNWQMELDFNTPDHCRDVSRILRLPGTINRPDAKKVAKGRVPALARIVSDANHEYPLSAFMATPGVSANNSATVETKINLDIQRVETIDSLPRDVPERVKIMIVQGFDPEDKAWNGDRSDALFYVCCELVRCGIKDELILGIITDSRFGISASILDKGSGTMRYATRQISRARDKAFHPKLAEMNQEYAVIADFGERCVIMNERPDGSLSFRKFSEFSKSRDHQKIEFEVGGKIKVKGIGSWWFDQTRRRQYEYVEFEPGENNPGCYNLWRGFTVEPTPGDKHMTYLEHMYENICSGNDAHYDYLLKWMARVVQQPRTRCMVAPVLLGKRGTGKSVFTDYFKGLFGRHSVTVSDVNKLTGRFNAHLMYAVLVIAEEAFDLRDKRHESVLKELITGQTISVEYKGLNVIQAKNYTHYILTSNNERVVPAGDNERRFFVIRVSEKHIQDAPYFERILADEKSGGLSNLLHHLLSIDLSDYRVTTIPETIELRKQQEHNIPPEIDWLSDKLEIGEWLQGKRWTGPIPKDELYQDYVRYCETQKIAKIMSRRKFVMWLQTELPTTTDKQLSPQPDGSRPWVFVFPSIEECRRQYDQNRGWINHEWRQLIMDVDEKYPLDQVDQQKKVFE